MSDDRNTAALRKLIRNHHIARKANEAYFKAVNHNWKVSEFSAPKPELQNPLDAALAVIEAAEDFAST
jgi:hypothetical protein